MNKKITYLIFGILLASIQIPGFCDCSIEGGVCGDEPTWSPCCNPDRFHCEIENPDAAEGEHYGVCVPNKDENSESE